MTGALSPAVEYQMLNILTLHVVIFIVSYMPSAIIVYIVCCAFHKAAKWNSHRAHTHIIIPSTLYARVQGSMLRMSM